MPFAFAITVVVAYLPYLGIGPPSVLGFLPGYVIEQGLASGEQFYILSVARMIFGRASIPNMAFLILALITVTSFAVWSVLKWEQHVDSYIKRACALVTIVIVFFAPHYSWYFAWLIPFLCFVPLPSLFYLTAASFVLYGSWLGDEPDQMFWLKSAIFLPFALLLAIEQMARSLRPRLTRQTQERGLR
jgi:hypothetical protein